jgi:hypothetical protein
MSKVVLHTIQIRRTVDQNEPADLNLFIACKTVAREVLWRNGTASTDLIQTLAQKFQTHGLAQLRVQKYGRRFKRVGHRACRRVGRMRRESVQVAAASVPIR